MPAEGKTANGPPADDTAESLANVAAEQGKRWAEATDKIRTRTQTTAQAIGALGTTGVTAAGLSKFGDIFPLPASPSGAQWLAIVGVLGGLVLMAGSVGWADGAVLESRSADLHESGPQPDARRACERSGKAGAEFCRV